MNNKIIAGILLSELPKRKARGWVGNKKLHKRQIVKRKVSIAAELEIN